MKLRTLRYYVGEALRNLVRNRLMSVASVLTVASCIFIVSVFYCLAANVDYFLNQLEGSLQIAVFLREDLSPDEVQLLSDKILTVPHVTGARYVTPQQSLDKFKEGLENPDIADGFDYDNPFRRSFDIEIDDLTYHDDVVNALGELESYGVANVRHAKDIADIVQAVSRTVRVIFMALIFILAAISIVIITNTIRITVNTRQAEINIMKYVGATDWFIRWPFAVEGVIIGLIGGVLPAAACWFGYGRVIGMITARIPIAGFMAFLDGYMIFSYLFPFSVLLGAFIGVAGSSLSIRKHLKV